MEANKRERELEFALRTFATVWAGPILWWASFLMVLSVLMISTDVLLYALKLFVPELLHSLETWIANKVTMIESIRRTSGDTWGTVWRSFRIMLPVFVLQWVIPIGLLLFCTSKLRDALRFRFYMYSEQLNPEAIEAFHKEQEARIASKDHNNDTEN